MLPMLLTPFSSSQTDFATRLGDVLQTSCNRDERRQPGRHASSQQHARRRTTLTDFSGEHGTAILSGLRHGLNTCNRKFERSVKCDEPSHRP